ncbi:hypothetical protein BURK_003772 [Burkholderia sp. SJ98]|nr:hypothetical protein BURK_003772 [Burkholderia sp. SJ98]
MTRRAARRDEEIGSLRFSPGEKGIGHMSVSADQAQINEETMQEPLDVFVLRKAVTGSYIVGSYHRVMGPVFLDAVRSVERHCGLTLNLDRAHRFERDTVDIDGFLSKLDESYHESGVATGDFASLCNNFSVTRGALAEWARATPWIEVFAPAPPLYLLAFEAGIERSSPWTRDIAQAHRFSAREILLEPSLRRIEPHGRFVSLTAGGGTATGARKAAQEPWINHPLEADLAWSMWQLSVRYGFDDVSARRAALRHAAAAGWESAAAGVIETSGHIARSPELRQSFETGRALCYATNHLIRNAQGNC